MAEIPSTGVPSLERRARVWLWLAWQAGRERDDLAYAYPRPDGWEDGYDRLEAVQAACVARAERLLPGCGSGPVWHWAVDTFRAVDDVPFPGGPVRVYVAAATAEVERAAIVMAAVRLAGHEVTHDWTEEVRAATRHGLRDQDLPDDVARTLARWDLAGVMSADLLLLLEPPAGHGLGCWVELGAALAVRELRGGVPRVVIVGHGKHLFSRLADAVYDCDAGAVAGMTAWRVVLKY